MDSYTNKEEIFTELVKKHKHEIFRFAKGYVHDDYIADDLRGESISAGMFREMLNGMLFTGDAKNQKRMDKNVPILLISGNNDPVGESGKGVKRTYDSLKKAGVENVAMKLYPGLRHDILREKEKMDVFGDIYKWMAV